MSRFKHIKLLLVSLIVLINLFSFILFIIQPFEDLKSLKFWGEQAKLIAPETQTVYISGAVKSPGVYAVSKNMRLARLIALAGGFEQDVDSKYINNDLNLAKKVADEDHIFIPNKNVLLATSTGNSNSNLDKVDINSASLEELETLVGVGTATAEKIIAARPYSETRQLLGVSGIGQTTFLELQDKVTVKL